MKTGRYRDNEYFLSEEIEEHENRMKADQKIRFNYESHLIHEIVLGHSLLKISKTDYTVERFS